MTAKTYPFSMGKASLSYRFWAGEQLTSDTLAIDTETALIDEGSHEIPQLALLSASNITHNVIVRPDQAADFLVAHRSCDLIAHNWSFDFHVLRQFFADQRRFDALQVLFAAGDEFRLHDTMWLDALYQLAAFDLPPVPRDLGTVARKYARLSIDKDDPFRMRYAETIGANWARLDPGFWAYAIKDAAATYAAMGALYDLSCRVARQHGVDQELIDRYGPLTEALQTNCAIVFAEMTRSGIAVDVEHAATMRDQKQRLIDEMVSQIEVLVGQSLFRRDRQGQFKMTDSGRPSMDTKGQLQPLLERIADEHDIAAPQTTRGITTSRKFWEEYRDADPFLDAYCQLDERAKLFSFFKSLDADRIHPTFNPLVKTGRSSCSKPNFQQMPRDPEFRSLFVASPGSQLLTIDVNAIELRCLAAVCRSRYGESKLAEAFERGDDPHGLLAASFYDEPFEQFKQRADYKRRRQQVKPISFGVPGGMHAPTIAATAHRNYGIDLTEDEAEAFRMHMITTTYPELSQYLESDRVAIVAANLRTDRQSILSVFGDGALLGALRRVVSGHAYKRDTGEPYETDFVDRLWHKLAVVNRNPHLVDLIEKRQCDPLHKFIFWQPVVSLTGRVRARASYNQAANYPFQSTASDGCKLALWRLYRRGFRLVGFIHDEVLVELPDDGRSKRRAEQVNRILCDAVSEVLDGLPVECEYVVGRCWGKP